MKISYQKTPNNFAKLLGALGATPSGCTKKCYHWKFIQMKTSYQKTPNNFAKLLGALGATPSGCTKKCYHWKFTQIKTSYQKTLNNFAKLLGALGATPSGYENLRKYLRAWYTSPTRTRRLIPEAAAPAGSP